MEDIPSISNINIEDLLKDLENRSAKITISGEDLNDTITLSGNPFNNSTITAGGYSFPSSNVSISSPGAMTGTIGSNASPYTYNSVAGGLYTINSGAGTGYPWATTNVTPKIRLDGEGADIEVNGWSLIDAIKKIQERLNVLTVNEKLEQEWEELRALGEQYRALEQHIKDKQATWDRLKAMPPPVID
jgi:hypothetical protein